MYANGAAAAAVDLGLGPTPGSGRAAAPTAADVGPAPAVGRAPVAPAAAAAVADVEVKVEKDDRIATPPPLTQPGPDEAIHGRRRAREDVRDNRKAGAAKAPKSKENLTDARSSETEESEQARNKAREICERLCLSRRTHLLMGISRGEKHTGGSNQGPKRRWTL